MPHILEPPPVYAQPGQHSHLRPTSASSIDELLHVKHAADPHMLYPNHGFARGGVGHLVSTGNARGGMNRLPQTTRSFRSPLATRSLSAHSSTMGSRASSRPHTVSTSPSFVGTAHAPHPHPHVEITAPPPATQAEGQPASLTHRSSATAAQDTARAGTVASEAGGLQGQASGHALVHGTSLATSTFRPMSTGTSVYRSKSGHQSRPRTSAGTMGMSLQNTLPPPALRSACKAWEQDVPHPADFSTATRRTRIHDVPAASKWSSISFYETDPDEIRRHIDIVNALEEMHANGVLEDRQLEDMRHMTWAQRQRQIFLRQRQERALAYAQSGVPVRPAYQLTAAASSAGSPEGIHDFEGNPGAEASSRRAAMLNGARPCSTGSISSYVPRWGGSPTGEWGTQTGLEGMQGSGRIDLPKPTFRKIYDRMGAETADSPRQVALAWQQKQESIKKSKEALAIASQLRELDDFEGHYRQLMRSRGSTLHGGKHYS